MKLQVSDLDAANLSKASAEVSVGSLNDRILYPRGEAAHQLGISKRMLDEYAKVGEIHPRFVGGKVLYHRSELERFAKTNHASPFMSGASTAAPEQSGPQSAPVDSRHLAA